MFNGFGIQEAFWMGVIIGVMAVVAVAICFAVVVFFDAMRGLIDWIERKRRAREWNKLSREERRKRIAQAQAYMPNRFPLENILKHIHNHPPGTPEFQWREMTNLKPPHTPRETGQTPPAPHDESLPE